MTPNPAIEPELVELINRCRTCQHDTCLEAADAITALREERDRMREALERIAPYDEHYNRLGEPQLTRERMMEEAVAALNGSPDQ